MCIYDEDINAFIKDTTYTLFELRIIPPSILRSGPHTEFYQSIMYIFLFILNWHTTKNNFN